jgi:hypothetical protein
MTKLLERTRTPQAERQPRKSGGGTKHATKQTIGPNEKRLNARLQKENHLAGALQNILHTVTCTSLHEKRGMQPDTDLDPNPSRERFSQAGQSVSSRTWRKKLQKTKKRYALTRQEMCLV